MEDKGITWNGLLGGGGSDGMIVMDGRALLMSGMVALEVAG